MKTICRFLLPVTLFVAAAAAQPRVGGLALDDPPQRFGNCNPTRLHFNGRINATGPMDVTYQWIRSDNASAPIKVLHFVRSGPLTINYDWTIRGSAKGWVAFKIISPQQIESRHVAFTINCR
ncbi:MAG TPA: hypothetical protein VGV35_02150 [Bryobacteraceae bacterium]|nr:hypothetical protein [Bryobacteraceae bacterium]